MSRSPPPDGLFRRLASATDESAAVAMFVQLCRSSPELRHWLWADFARSPSTRAKLAAVLKSPAGELTRFADLTGESDAWRAERRRLQAKWSRQCYGGLTFDELVQLLIQHQAGGIDPAAFLLAAEWRRRDPAKSPIVLQAVFDFVSTAVADGRLHLLPQLGKAAELTKDFANPAQRRALIGHADWWKTHVLIYLLRHPAPAYRPRDLHAHLRTLGLRVTTRDLRRFCTAHGIRRDMRAGRPKRFRNRDAG